MIHSFRDPPRPGNVLKAGLKVHKGAPKKTTP